MVFLWHDSAMSIPLTIEGHHKHNCSVTFAGVSITQGYTIAWGYNEKFIYHFRFFCRFCTELMSRSWWCLEQVRENPLKDQADLFCKGMVEIRKISWCLKNLFKWYVASSTLFLWWFFWVLLEGNSVGCCKAVGPYAEIVLELHTSFMAGGNVFLGVIPA